MKSKINKLNPQTAASIAIVVVVAAVVVYVFWNKIVALIRDAKTENQLQEEANQYGTPTLTNSQISSLAAQIYNAFKFDLFYNWGTKEKVVERVFSQLGNNADYAALQIAYLAVNKSSAHPTLDDRIGYEGTESEKQRWRNILNSKNITIYTF